MGPINGGVLMAQQGDDINYKRINDHAKELAAMIVDEYNLVAPSSFMRRMFALSPGALWKILIPGYTRIVEDEILELMKKKT